MLAKHNVFENPEAKVQAVGFHTLPLQLILGRDKLYIADKAPDVLALDRRRHGR